MSGLYSTLGNSVKALAAHSRAIETAGKNLANVNNPAYARQRVHYGDRGMVETTLGVQGSGLEALAIQQLRDTLLDKQLMREIALRSSFQSEQRTLERAQAGLGQNINRAGASSGTGSNAATGGLAAALDDYFNAFQGLAARPTDSGERQTLIQKTAILTDSFRNTDARLEQVQGDIGIEISADVADVNRLLVSIAELNGQIGRSEINLPRSAVDLRDQRQARLEELAVKLPIEVRDTTDGQVQVVLRDSSNSDVVLVDLAQVVGAVAFDGTGLTAGSGATPVEFASGSIRGLLNARDGAVQTLRDNLNQMARQLVTSVNAAYNPTGAANGDFFNAAGLSAGTIAIASNVTAGNVRAGTGAAGDNSIALAIAGIANQAFSTNSGDIVDGTLGKFYSRAVSNLGQALASANARFEDQANITNLIKAQREGVSGVSIDEEMADLVRFQRAFQASSRVFAIVDELLDTVVNRLGRA